jgi:hypothetical protein
LDCWLRLFEDRDEATSLQQDNSGFQAVAPGNASCGE